MSVPEEVRIAMLESFSAPLLLVGEDGTVRYANGEAGNFWRTPAERLAGRKVLPLFGGDRRVALAVARAIADDASSTIEGVRMEGKAEPPAVLRVQVDPVLVPGRKVDSALVALWDETHRHQLEAATREQGVMESIGLMVQRLAHELQNPLSGMKGATQLLARRLTERTGHAEYLGVILKEMERMERLVASLLAYGADTPLNRAGFNLHALLDEVLWFVSNSGADVKLEREYDPSLPEIYADRDRLHQVLLNLIRNAVEASPAGGTIRLRTGIAGPWQEGGNLPDPAATYFRVQVEDEGQGIAPEHREKLFTPFFTTKKNGTGLGLPISYHIVRAHEGRLLYAPGKSRGSVFTILLPMKEQ